MTMNMINQHIRTNLKQIPKPQTGGGPGFSNWTQHSRTGWYSQFMGPVEPPIDYDQSGTLITMMAVGSCSTIICYWQSGISNDQLDFADKPWTSPAVMNYSDDRLLSMTIDEQPRIDGQHLSFHSSPLINHDNFKGSPAWALVDHGCHGIRGLPISKEISGMWCQSG